MTEYETFMVYELDDSGEKVRLDMEEEHLQENLHPEQQRAVPVALGYRRWGDPRFVCVRRFAVLQKTEPLLEQCDQRRKRRTRPAESAGNQQPKVHRCWQLAVPLITARSTGHLFQHLTRHQGRPLLRSCQLQLSSVTFSPTIIHDRALLCVSDVRSTHICTSEGFCIKSSRLTTLK